MQDLTVIGVESGALLAASEDGERYRIAIDEVLQSRLRRSTKEPSQAGSSKVSPREIQAYIRGGMSAADVADLTGADTDYISRFEGPIIAEREHIVASALSVPVRTVADVDPVGEQATFGVVIRQRLESLAASGERWASWKETDGGWIVKLAFASDEIDHDARWSFDPRRHALAPMNSEATTLSQQGELQGGLIPRLRVVSPGEPDESRFDSGAFTFVEDSDTPKDSAAVLEQVSMARSRPSGTNSIAVTAIKRSDEQQSGMHQTADLLDALRKRRGEREAAHAEGEQDAHPRPVDVPLAGFEVDEGDPAAAGRGESSHGQGRHGARKGRASMPSWDEIVFGARTDDDLA